MQEGTESGRLDLVCVQSASSMPITMDIAMKRWREIRSRNSISKRETLRDLGLCI